MRVFASSGEAGARAGGEPRSSHGEEGQAREDQARVVGRDRTLLHHREEQAEHARTSSSSRSTTRWCASTSSTRRRSSSSDLPPASLSPGGRGPPAEELARPRPRTDDSKEGTMAWVITRIVPRLCRQVLRRGVPRRLHLRVQGRRCNAAWPEPALHRPPKSASTAASASPSARGRRSSRTSRFPSVFHRRHAAQRQDRRRSKRRSSRCPTSKRRTSRVPSPEEIEEQQGKWGYDGLGVTRRLRHRRLPPAPRREPRCSVQSSQLFSGLVDEHPLSFHRFARRALRRIPEQASSGTGSYTASITTLSARRCASAGTGEASLAKAHATWC